MASSLDVKFTWKDQAKMQAAIEGLPLKVLNSTMRSALKEGMTDLMTATQAKTPTEKSGGGKLKAGFKLQNKTIDSLTVSVLMQNTVWYAALVEYAHRYLVYNHYIKHPNVKKKLVAFGPEGPYPYMRPAFDAEKDKIMRTIMDRLEASISKQWGKINSGS